jgi:microcystin-dependent protein
MYDSAIAPSGWSLCDGTNGTPDLRNMFVVGAGSSYSVGSTGGETTVTLSAAQSGLVGHNHTASSGNQSASHYHSANPPATNSGTVSAWHTHSGTTQWMDRNNVHNHDAYTREGLTTGDSNAYLDSADSDGSGTLRWDTVVNQSTDTNHLHAFTTGNPSANHYHQVDIPSFNTGNQSASHSHTVTVNTKAAASATASHENRPPYYALTYIRKN